MATNILKNTILTDFIDILARSSSGTRAGGQKSKEVIRKFRGYAVSAPKTSLSYVALISPYLSMLKGGAAIPAGDFNIAVEKLDHTIKSAKGYYEFVGSKDKEKVIFRFNINSFKNNYKVTDLLKMDISIYATKVGKSSISKLDFNNELDIDSLSGRKDNPSYDKKKDQKDNDPSLNELLDVYDVFLAGVESDG